MLWLENYLKKYFNTIRVNKVSYSREGKIDQEQIDNWIDSMSGRIIEWINHDEDMIK